MSDSDWMDFHPYILQLEQEGKVTRTFRRLDPDRQATILDAILEEAAQRGPASLNIKEVARRAGVSVGSLYQYFPNRDGMLDFAVELSTRSTIAMFEEYKPMLAAMPIREALRAYLLGGLEWGKMMTGFVRFFGRAAYQGDPDLSKRAVQPIATVMRESMEEILSQGKSRGEIRPDLDIEATARVINALMIVVADSQLLPYLNTYFQIYDDTISPERVSNTLLEFIERVLVSEAK